MSLFTKQKLNKLAVLENELMVISREEIDWNVGIDMYTVKFNSVPQSCPTLCDPMKR